MPTSSKRWPDFFTEDCFYRITSAENYEAGLPLGLIYATSRNMLRDRVSALREANIYEPQRYRHLISSIRVVGETAGALDLEANFLVVRTMQDGEMTIFAAGHYVDRVVRRRFRLEIRAQDRSSSTAARSTPCWRSRSDLPIAARTSNRWLPREAEMAAKSHAYVIVGAGSAGCTLANRLSEDADATVLVLEAGGWDRDPWIQIPLGWGRILERRLHDWMYFSEPEENANGRRIECARGKVVGGSSSINAMALCPRQSRRLRPLGRGRARYLVLCACAALLPPPGKLGRRCERLSRRRWPVDRRHRAL